MMQEFFAPILYAFACFIVRNIEEGRRIVGSIWNVGVGDLSSSAVQNANSGIPLKVD